MVGNNSSHFVGLPVDDSIQHDVGRRDCPGQTEEPRDDVSTPASRAGPRSVTLGGGGGKS